MPKKLTDQQLLGAQGTALIDQTVSRIGFVWRPTAQHDVGIDGEIEIRDTVSGQMTGRIIKVQSKAVSSFANETDDGFDFWPAERDIQYWLSHNVPVILIVSRPATNEVYWLSVRQQVAGSPAIKRFHFVKTRDRLDASARMRLSEIVQPEKADVVTPTSDKIEPPGQSEGGLVLPAPAKAPPDDDNEAEIRYINNRHNSEIWGGKIYLAFVTIFGGFAAVMLPLMLKSGLTGQEVMFATTRIDTFINGGAIPSENIYKLSLILSAPNALGLWFIGKFLAHPIAGGIRHSWCKVDEALYRRIVAMCILASAFVLAGHYCWLLFPSVAYWKALCVPLGAFAAMWVHAKNG